MHICLNESLELHLRDAPVHRSSRAALTLVELLVVLAIIGLLLALLLPAVQMAREQARRTQCASHLRQIGQGLLMFHDSKGFLPQTRTVCYHGTWASEVLPYIDQQPIADRRDRERSFFFQPVEAIQAQVPIYYCPSRRGPQLSIDGDNKGGNIPHRPGALSNYAVVAGDGSAPDVSDKANGPFIAKPADDESYCRGIRPDWRFIGQYGRTINLAAITDGLSNTLFVGEKHVQDHEFGHRESGDNCIYNGDHGDAVTRFGGVHHRLASSTDEPGSSIFGGHHVGICQFAFGDGRVMALANRIDGIVIGRLSNRRDGESIPDGAL